MRCSKHTSSRKLDRVALTPLYNAQTFLFAQPKPYAACPAPENSL